MAGITSGWKWFSVPDDFQVMVPVTLEFRGWQIRHQLVRIVGEVSTLKLGPFTNEPNRIIFNNFGGTLTRRTTVVPQLATGASPGGK